MNQVIYIVVDENTAPNNEAVEIFQAAIISKILTFAVNLR